MSLARDLTTVGSATLISRLLGFLRDMAIAAMLGTGVFSDAFFAVLQVTNVFRRLLAEGALNAAFIPTWLRIKTATGEDGAYAFLREVFGAMTLAAGALALVGLLFAPMIVAVVAPGFDPQRGVLAADYLRIAAPYVLLAGVVAVIVALLSAEGRVGAVALGVVAFNAVLLAALILLGAFGSPAPQAVGTALATAIVLAGVAHLVVATIGLVRLRRGLALPRPRLALSPDTRRFFALAIPGLVAASIPQLKLIAGAMVASSSPAAVSWLYYANRLYELPLGVASIAIAAVLVPSIAASVRSADGAAIAAAQSRALEIGLGVALPAAVAFALLAAPIAGGLFERGAFGPRDTAAVAAALAAICSGLPGHVLEKVLGAVAFAHEDARTPMLAALAGLATATIGALVLFPHYGHVGVAAAIALSGWVGAILLAAVLTARRWLRFDRAAVRRLPRIVLATVVMGATLIGAQPLLAPMLSGTAAPRIAALALLVALGLAVYLAAIDLSGVARLRDLVAAVRRRP